MSKKHKYTGGAWEIGSVTADRPAIDGRSSAARLLAHLARVKRYEDHARQRAAEHRGTWHGRMWQGMEADNRAERDRLSALLERKQQRAA